MTTEEQPDDVNYTRADLEELDLAEWTLDFTAETSPLNLKAVHLITSLQISRLPQD